MPGMMMPPGVMPPGVMPHGAMPHGAMPPGMLPGMVPPMPNMTAMQQPPAGPSMPTSPPTPVDAAMLGKRQRTEPTTAPPAGFAVPGPYG